MEDSKAFIIVDKVDLYRMGISCVIQNLHSQSNVMSAFSIKELKKMMEANPEATVILDFESLENDTLDELKELSSKHPLINWLLTSEFIDESFLLTLSSSFEKANFVLKTNDYDQIALAIKSTYLGKKYVSSEALQILLNGHIRKSENLAKKGLLTPTEQELIMLFAQGKTAKEIAELRFLSYHTVNTHRKNIFRKLDVNNVQELIKYALKNGLVDLTEYYI
jgi:DNA-binding NarL/FixJ family response regulator